MLVFDCNVFIGVFIRYYLVDVRVRTSKIICHYHFVNHYYSAIIILTVKTCL